MNNVILHKENSILPNIAGLKETNDALDKFYGIHANGHATKGKMKRNKPFVVNPALANITDLVPWAIYDRVTTAAAANTLTQYVFYQQPIGTNSKTKIDTNMEQVMRLPDPEWMDVQKLGFSIAPDVASLDAFNLLAKYYWEFWVGGKIYAEGPIEIAASKTGVWAASDKANESFSNLGNPNDNDGGFDLRLPAGIQLTDANGGTYVTDGIKGCRILQGQQFQVKLIGTSFALVAAAGSTFGTGLNLRCYLKGIKSRIAQ